MVFFFTGAVAAAAEADKTGDGARKEDNSKPESSSNFRLVLPPATPTSSAVPLGPNSYRPSANTAASVTWAGAWVRMSRKRL